MKFIVFLSVIVFVLVGFSLEANVPHKHDQTDKRNLATTTAVTKRGLFSKIMDVVNNIPLVGNVLGNFAPPKQSSSETITEDIQIQETIDVAAKPIFKTTSITAQPITNVRITTLSGISKNMESKINTNATVQLTASTNNISESSTISSTISKTLPVVTSSSRQENKTPTISISNLLTKASKIESSKDKTTSEPIAPPLTSKTTAQVTGATKIKSSTSNPIGDVFNSVLGNIGSMFTIKSSSTYRPSTTTTAFKAPVLITKSPTISTKSPTTSTKSPAIVFSAIETPAKARGAFFGDIVSAIGDILGLPTTRETPTTQTSTQSPTTTSKTPVYINTPITTTKPTTSTAKPTVTTTKSIPTTTKSGINHNPIDGLFGGFNKFIDGIFGTSSTTVVPRISNLNSLPAITSTAKPTIATTFTTTKSIPTTTKSAQNNNAIDGLFGGFNKFFDGIFGTSSTTVVPRISNLNNLPAITSTAKPTIATTFTTTKSIPTTTKSAKDNNPIDGFFGGLNKFLDDIFGTSSTTVAPRISNLNSLPEITSAAKPIIITTTTTKSTPTTTKSSVNSNPIMEFIDSFMKAVFNPPPTSTTSKMDPMRATIAPPTTAQPVTVTPKPMTTRKPDDDFGQILSHIPILGPIFFPQKSTAFPRIAPITTMAPTTPKPNNPIAQFFEIFAPKQTTTSVATSKAPPPHFNLLENWFGLPKPTTTSTPPATKSEDPILCRAINAIPLLNVILKCTPPTPKPSSSCQLTTPAPMNPMDALEALIGNMPGIGPAFRLLQSIVTGQIIFEIPLFGPIIKSVVTSCADIKLNIPCVTARAQVGPCMLQEFD